MVPDGPVLDPHFCRFSQYLVNSQVPQISACTLHNEEREIRVIDMVRDYVWIGLGSVQATTTRALAAGRSGGGQLLAAATPPNPPRNPAEGMELARAALASGCGVVSDVMGADLEGVIGRLGLVKKSELIAVRQQIHRIERRMTDVRGDR